MVAHTFNPSIRDAEAGGVDEASLVYKVSSRTTRTIQRNPVLKNQNQNKTKKAKQNKQHKTKGQAW